MCLSALESVCILTSFRAERVSRLPVPRSRARDLTAGGSPFVTSLPPRMLRDSASGFSVLPLFHIWLYNRLVEGRQYRESGKVSAPSRDAEPSLGSPFKNSRFLVFQFSRCMSACRTRRRTLCVCGAYSTPVWAFSVWFWFHSVGRFERAAVLHLLSQEVTYVWIYEKGSFMLVLPQMQ